MDKLKNEEVFVLIYRGLIKDDQASKNDWSRLVVYANGEVFRSGPDDDFLLSPVKKEDSISTGELVRVEMLSALKPKKLAVGLLFGVALTDDGKLFKWCRGVPKEAVIMVQAYKDGPCHCGNTGGGRCARHDALFDLLDCSHTPQRFKTYTHSNPPPPNVAVWQFIRYEFIKISCFKCGNPCGESSCMFGGSFINQCKKCGTYAEATQLKTQRLLHSGIIDVDAGETFVCYVTEDFKVKLHDDVDNKTNACQLPEGELARSVSCGVKHIAVTTKSGNPYSYGELGEDMQVPTISLKKVIMPVPGRALEVSCWKASTAWLLQDESVFIFQNGMLSKRITPAAWFYNRSIKPVLELCDQWSWMLREILGQDSEAVSNSSTAEADRQQSNTAQHHVNLHPNQMKLYGQKRFSDLTIKLADEDFPAHWVILISTSQYFQKISTAGSDASTLDMSSYNPRAYRCLLQHFYQVPPNELPVSDLLDLLDLATSYEEPDVLKTVTESIKSLIDVENVLQILPKARALANQDLITACGLFVQTPAFKDHLVKVVMEEPTKFAELNVKDPKKT